MDKLVVLLILCICCLFSSCTLPSLMLSPEMERAVDSIPEKWGDEPVIIISDTTELEFAGGKKGNRLIETSSIVYFIRDRNPDLLQTIYVKFNESYEKPTDVRCEALYPDGSTWSVSGAFLPKYKVPTYYGYTSNQYFKEIILPKYSAGMYLKITEKRTYCKPEFYSFEMVSKGMPVINRCIRFTVPTQSKIRYEFMNGEGLKFDTQKTADKKRRSVTWSFRNIDKVENVDYYSRPGEWFASLYVSLPPTGLTSFSWSELGDYYLNQIRGAYTGTSQLSGFASSIRTSVSPDTLLQDILYLLRDRIRYHGDFNGIHAFIPHSIGSIIANGYGDCKDMAILSQSIAKTGGIKLNLVLLNANDGFQANPSVPTLGAFNHVIVAITMPDGKMLFADPTVTHGNPLETGFYYIGRRALILEEQGSYSDTLPRPAGFYNSVSTRSEISYNKNERRWELSGDILVCGLTAMHLYPDFSELTRQEQAPALRTYLRKYFELDVQDASFKRLRSDTISVHYTSSFQENYIRLLKGGFVLNKPSLYGGDVRFTTLDFPGPRYYREIRQRDTWQLPGRFNDLEKVEFESPIASGNWKCLDNAVERSFSQNAIKVKDGEAGKILAKKNRFLNAKVWKK